MFVVTTLQRAVVGSWTQVIVLNPAQEIVDKPVGDLLE